MQAVHPISSRLWKPQPVVSAGTVAPTRAPWAIPVRGCRHRSWKAECLGRAGRAGEALPAQMDEAEQPARVVPRRITGRSRRG